MFTCMCTLELSIVYVCSVGTFNYADYIYIIIFRISSQSNITKKKLHKHHFKYIRIIAYRLPY